VGAVAGDQGEQEELREQEQLEALLEAVKAFV
jgi:hypothetical protein